MKLEGNHGRPGLRRESSLVPVDDDELRDIFMRVIAVVTPEDAAYLDSLRQGYFGEARIGALEQPRNVNSHGK
jgi:hypothetical protein